MEETDSAYGLGDHQCHVVECCAHNETWTHWWQLLQQRVELWHHQSWLFAGVRCAHWHFHVGGSLTFDLPKLVNHALTLHVLMKLVCGTVWHSKHSCVKLSQSTIIFRFPQSHTITWCLPWPCSIPTNILWCTWSIDQIFIFSFADLFGSHLILAEEMQKYYDYNVFISYFGCYT